MAAAEAAAASLAALAQKLLPFAAHAKAQQQNVCTCVCVSFSAVFVCLRFIANSQKCFISKFVNKHTYTQANTHTHTPEQTDIQAEQQGEQAELESPQWIGVRSPKCIKCFCVFSLIVFLRFQVEG